MSAELYITFEDKNWFNRNRNVLKEQILSLNTFVSCEHEEFWLKGIESTNNPYYDVRLFLGYEDCVLLEITFHPLSIEQSVEQFLGWLRRQTSISVKDEDGEVSSW